MAAVNDAFDPYRAWLGIPPHQQPPHHYRLLGISLHESDPQVISNAADRQMAHVRTFQSGKRAAVSQRMLNELAAARLCLLDEAKRAAYDAALRSRATVSTPPPVIPPQRDAGVGVPVVLPAVGTPHVSVHSGGRRPTSTGPLLIAAGCVGGMVLLAVVIWAAISGTREENPTAGLDRTAQSSTDSSSRGTNTAIPTEKTDAAAPPFTQKRNKTAVKDSGRSKDTDEKNPLDKPATDDADKDPRGKNPASHAGEKGPVDKPAVENEPPAVATVEKIDPAPKDPPADPAATAIDWKTFSLSDTAASAKAAGGRRTLPLPEASVLGAERARLRRMYQGELARARRDRDARRALTKTLIAEATRSENDRPRQYLLLEQAHDLSIELVNPDAMTQIVDWMADLYAIDPLEKKLSALGAAAAAADEAEQLRSLVDFGRKLYDEADRRQRFDVAVRVARASAAAARKAKDAAAGRELDELARRAVGNRQDYLAAERALPQLAAHPDDAAANRVMGLYFVQHRHDWPRGLALLTKGDDEQLAELAAADLATPAGADAMIALGESWMNRAKRIGTTSRPQPQIALRAGHWYRRALEKASGVQRVEVQQRIKAVDAAVGFD